MISQASVILFTGEGVSVPTCTTDHMTGGGVSVQGGLCLGVSVWGSLSGGGLCLEGVSV